MEKILKANLPLLAQECMQETVSVQARIAAPKASSLTKVLGIDTSDEIIYRAKLLRQRYDELVVRCKQMNKKAQAAEVLKNFPKVDRICQWFQNEDNWCRWMELREQLER